MFRSLVASMAALNMRPVARVTIAPDNLTLDSTFLIRSVGPCCAFLIVPSMSKITNL